MTQPETDLGFDNTLEITPPLPHETVAEVIFGIRDQVLEESRVAAESLANFEQRLQDLRLDDEVAELLSYSEDPAFSQVADMLAKLDRPITLKEILRVYFSRHLEKGEFGRLMSLINLFDEYGKLERSCEGDWFEPPGYAENIGYLTPPPEDEEFIPPEDLKDRLRAVFGSASELHISQVTRGIYGQGRLSDEHHVAFRQALYSLGVIQLGRGFLALPSVWPTPTTELIDEPEAAESTHPDPVIEGVEPAEPKSLDDMLREAGVID